MQTAPKKVINGWAMYDWANSVYNLVITSTIFPAYYEAVTGDHNDATANDTVHLFGREYFFNEGNLGYGLLCLIIACIGYWASLVFYNSYLPEIAAPEDQDRVSAKGYAMGYIGSVILQVICFVFVLGHKSFGITEAKGSQLSFLLVGIWWWGFGQLALRRLPKGTPIARSTDRGSVFTHGYKELRKVWNQLTNLPVLKRYLAAFFFYNMGVQTVMLVATLYGKSELNIPTPNLIISILIIQLVAIPGAYLIAKLSDKVGNFKALMVTVFLWIALCYIGYLLPRDGIYEFYGLATLVGFVMGGIQSLSRSTYAKLMPETKDTTSFFSFHDVTEKIAIVIGMLSFGYINELAGTQRKSVLALMVFFFIGLILLVYASRASKKQNS
jgi:UMF1 family MFS transporter